jgi:hypothetical protein
LQIFFAIIVVFLPEVALANSMAPIFPIISGIGWIAMPIIIVLESLFYCRKLINNPFRLALYSNIVSALFGLIVAVVTLPIMAGPAVDPYLWAIYLGAVLSSVAIVSHWWFSSYLEYRFSKWHTLWKNRDFPISIFYKANAITYSLIYLLFVVLFLKQLSDYYART